MTVTTLILSLLCIFECICVPAIFLHVRLWGVVLLYVIAVLVYFYVLWRKKQLPAIKKQKSDCAEDTDDNSWIKWKWLCILLIGFQLILVVFYTHIDDDDAWYLGAAASAYETGEMFAYSPYTGNPVELSAGGDYVLSPLPMLWAVLGKLLFIHPTVLAHSIVPIFVLLCAYVVYYMLGKRLFHTPKSAWLFVLFLSLLNIFGYYSTRTTGAFLLFRSWQGKAIFCTVLVPLLFYYFLGLCKEEKEYKKDLMGIYLIMGAGCLVSFTAVSLMPLLLGAMTFTLAVGKRELRLPLKMCGAMIPNVILVLIYIVAL